MERFHLSFEKGIGVMKTLSFSEYFAVFKNCLSITIAHIPFHNPSIFRPRQGDDLKFTVTRTPPSVSMKTK